MRLLDDPGTLARADPGGMLGLVASTGTHVRDGYAIGRAATSLPSGDGIRSMLVCGMGGSGIAGDVVRALASARLGVPVAVVKGYELPEFCGKDTLVIAVSFSGNTEETLFAFRAAVKRGCRIVTMSAGGELERLSKEQDVAHVSLPSSVPMPRAAFGYLVSCSLGLLEATGLLPNLAEEVAEASRMLDELSERLGPAIDGEENPAKSLAGWIGARIPVIWGSEGVGETAALRWKTQMNENAKTPAFRGTLPELDHNEIEGWSPGSGAGFALIVLRHHGEGLRIGARVDASLEAIRTSGMEARQVWADRGDGSTLGTLLGLAIMGDFTSCYLGILMGRDPFPVPVLTELKERLRP